jgi:hypothetical protein
MARCKGVSDPLLREVQEEQRRISNREAVRDEWLALMRDVAAAASNAFRNPAAAAPGSARAGSGSAISTAGRRQR